MFHLGLHYSLTRQDIVDGCGDVYVLQVFQGLSVEEAYSWTGAERDPNAHSGHHHVRHHHALFLVGFQLPLDDGDRQSDVILP